MDADVIYVVVRESGEYSDWQKENLAFFRTYADASQYIRQLELLDTTYGMVRRSTSYSIEEIFLGQL
jgi:hypothetical protein